ncbi:nucleoside transporter like protein [Zymoseptoria brevis]|uniref:Nucleoside transporter like protein n=1 Tax=Zymoseptoria brevis TaxID=1047168 RepID=A0A0F4GJY7_9PEZI|nr:nucleoside transporter like protein [Zymoseptoria brevis]
MPDLDSRDVEKNALDSPEMHDPESTTSSTAPEGRSRNILSTIKQSIINDNFEARGVQRVLPAERNPTSTFGFLQVMLMWMSINMTAVVIVLGFLGPINFSLSFKDASLVAVFGAILGATPVAYTATFGPRSGNRTMILTRYITGWWPSKVIVTLTLIILMGYVLLDAVIGGQILSAVSPNASLSVIVGIVIVCVLTWIVTAFGYSVFHHFERYAWLPSLIVICFLIGVSAPKWNLEPGPDLPTRTLAGNRLSFFSLCLAAEITYAGSGADMFVYYPSTTSRTKVFLSTLAGLTLSSAIAIITGIGLGSGTLTDPAWSSAYSISAGALIVEAFRPLGGFGSFCSVLVALGIVANMVLPTYASGVDLQAFGRWFERIPRIVWNTVALVVPMIGAIAGREHLAEIFSNFLALMGYWVSIWIAIVVEEHILFRKLGRKGWKWEDWNDRTKLPIGIAAGVAFLVGWVGAILGMSQVWYVGPLAKLVSEQGADIGNYVGFSWALVVYPPLRWVELRWIGR